MNHQTFLDKFAMNYRWKSVPTKRNFRNIKQVNKGMIEEHRLALTLGGVIDRSLDDVEGLQSSDYSTYQIFEKDDLVFKLIDLENIKTSRVGHVPRRGIMSPAYIRLSPASELVITRYYYWLFYAAYINNIFNGMGGGVRQNLTPTDLLEFPIPLTPKETQKKITNFLDRETARIDQLIKKKQRLIVVLQEKQANLINHIVRQGIQPNLTMKRIDFPGIELIPECWEVKKLRHLGSLQNGVSEGAEYFGEGYPFVGYGDVYNHFALPANVNGLAKSSDIDRKRYSVLAGDVFFTRTSEVAEEIGISSVCIETIDNATFSGFLIRFRPNAKTLLPNFSKYYFRSDIPRLFFVKEMNLVTRVSLSQGLLKSLPVIIPPIEEQEEISHYLDTKIAKINLLIKNVEHSINHLKEFRIALITEVVTGQLDINSWNKRGSTDERIDNIEEAMRT